MKLTKQTKTILQNAIEIGTTLGIENLVMDSFSLRGENKELGIAVIMPTKGISLEFDAIGLGRIGTLKNKFSILTDPTIDFELSDRRPNENIVSKLRITSGKTKIEFKCHDPAYINAPKAINDPVFYEMTLSETDIALIIKGMSAMSTDTISFSVESDIASITINDIQGDNFYHELTTNIEKIDDSADTLSKTYKSKTLKIILNNYMRKDDNNMLPIAITRRGVMRISVLDMNIYLFPER